MFSVSNLEMDETLFPLYWKYFSYFNSFPKWFFPLTILFINSISKFQLSWRKGIFFYRYIYRLFPTYLQIFQSYWILSDRETVAQSLHWVYGWNSEIIENSICILKQYRSANSYLGKEYLKIQFSGLLILFVVFFLLDLSFLEPAFKIKISSKRKKRQRNRKRKNQPF